MSTPKNILVIDVESTCWENLPPNKFPETRNEIIEIGIAVIDIKKREITESCSILVTPPTTEISDFCTQLTGIDSPLIALHGIPFADAIAKLRDEYKAHRQVFASWGAYDQRSFVKNCEWNKVAYPFSNLHLNIKSFCAVKMGYTGGEKKIGDDLGIPFIGRQHNGRDDAVHAAKILLKLL